MSRVSDLQKRFSIFFLVAVAITLGCDREGVKPEPPPRTVRVVQASAPDRAQTLRFPGLASAAREVNLSFHIGGTLQSRSADVGQEVRQGELLARLDEEDLRLSVARAAGEALRATASLQRAQADHLRLRRVAEGDPRATSKQALDAAREGEEGAAAAVAAAQASLSLAENQHSYAQLRAPFAGRVVAVFAEEHQEVAPREPVLRLLDTSEVEMVIHVSERVMPLLAKEGIHLSVTYDLYPGQPLDAVVKKVGGEAEAVTRTYPITLRMTPKPGMTIWAGLVGQATFFTPPGGLVNSAVVPLSAVIAKQGDAGCCWLVEGSPPRAVCRHVSIASLRDDGLLVAGISPGETVVTAGAHFLYEGELLQPMRRER